MKGIDFNVLIFTTLLLSLAAAPLCTQSENNVQYMLPTSLLYKNELRAILAHDLTRL